MQCFTSRHCCAVTRVLDGSGGMYVTWDAVRLREGLYLSSYRASCAWNAVTLDVQKSLAALHSAPSSLLPSSCTLLTSPPGANVKSAVDLPPKFLSVNTCHCLIALWLQKVYSTAGLAAVPTGMTEAAAEAHQLSVHCNPVPLQYVSAPRHQQPYYLPLSKR